ncbi:MAG TPA: DUF397 domain-containing protein [Trebonia sp.]|jgi:hypothetical protein
MSVTPQEKPGPTWIKSSLSYANGNCVEIADLGAGNVGVRNSRDPGGAVLKFTPAEWRAFVGGMLLGDFASFGRA